jgi:PAS domain S-box-containing protein
MAFETNRLFRNAAERERLKPQLEGRSLLLFVTLASIGDAVITTDGDGDITFLNPMAQTLTGWTLEEAVGVEIERVFKVVDETTGEEIPNPIREALSKVTKVDLPADAMLVRKDGSRIPIDDSGAPILGLEDEILGAVLVFRDITERKEAEDMLKYRSELDRMASRISTAFITSPVSEVNKHINEALKGIGEFFGADRT